MILSLQRHARGWHDDDAAWDAFLTQADDSAPEGSPATAQKR